MAYVDGFVLPLHPDKHDAYKAMAETFAREAAKLGGISIESLGDGLEPAPSPAFRARFTRRTVRMLFSLL
jgi:uncharacterized protein YbaA (DUF1428 family)